MSATNRGAERHAHDFYPTPSHCVHRLLEKVALPGGRWLEPCVGDGAIVRAVNAVRTDVEWGTIDIRPECESVLDEDRVRRHWVGDFLAVSPDDFPPFDVVLTNPIFALSREMAAHAMRFAPVVAFLLRLNWLRGPDDHNAWIRQHMPSVHVLPQRPSFDGKGTDATEYSWMVWGVDEVPRIYMLDDTPDAVRAAHNQEMRRREWAVGSLFDREPESQLALPGDGR